LRVRLTDQTEAWATLGLMGPRARDVLSRVSDADLSTAAFPYGTVREITVAGVAVRAIRVSYAGELGWELYVPSDDAPEVWDALMAGDDLTPAGYYALDSLRIEKGYRAWGRELTPHDTPLEAGLGFTVRLDKPGFIGRARGHLDLRRPRPHARPGGGDGLRALYAGIAGRDRARRTL
jgi:4-methylaminobutanoate oxidase (formaldehyde-forming)